MVLTFFCSVPVTAQESSGEKAPLVQHLSWTKSEGALRYEAVITKANREVIRVGPEHNFLDVQLSPGTYQMEVMVFDFLDRPAGSATTTFEVLMIRYPEITSYSPRSFKLIKGKFLEIVVEGRNFTGDSRFYLSADPKEPKRSDRRIPAENVRLFADGQKVTFTVPMSALAQMDYRIEVENPGGIVATSDIIAFGSKPKPAPSKAKK
jgi:hypothetical protein